MVCVHLHMASAGMWSWAGRRETMLTVGSAFPWLPSGNTGVSESVSLKFHPRCTIHTHPTQAGGEGLWREQPTEGMAILLVPPQGYAWWSGKCRGTSGKCDANIKSCWWGYARLPAFGSLCLGSPLLLSLVILLSLGKCFWHCSHTPISPPFHRALGVLQWCLQPVSCFPV